MTWPGPEVIQEFAKVRARQRDRDDAVLLANANVAVIAPLQVMTAQHLQRGWEIWLGKGERASNIHLS